MHTCETAGFDEGSLGGLLLQPERQVDNVPGTSDDPVAFEYNPAEPVSALKHWLKTICHWYKTIHSQAINHLLGAANLTITTVTPKAPVTPKLQASLLETLQEMLALLSTLTIIERPCGRKPRPSSWAQMLEMRSSGRH